MTPDFLEHLGLAEDADERAIKRAYARQLKQIDQAADPAGFQTLREAYEAALHWHHTRGAREAGTPEADQAPGSETATVDQAETAQPPDAETPAEPPPHAEVLEVVAQFMGNLTTHDGDKTSMLKALAACMDDPRLQGLDSRDMFEWFVARTLAEGWKPGHEVLLVAAIEFFEWSQDRRRLMRFGRVGQVLDESIAERMVFDGQPLDAHARQKELIRLLRRPPREPDADQAKVYRNELELMVHHFPNWLWMVVPAERVHQWRQWANGTPQGSMGHQGTPLTPGTRPVPELRQAATPAPQTKQGSPMWAVFAILMLLGVLSRSFDTRTPQYVPQSSPTWQAPTQTSPPPLPQDPVQAIYSYGDQSASKPRARFPDEPEGGWTVTPPMYQSQAPARPLRGASEKDWRADDTTHDQAEADHRTVSPPAKPASIPQVTLENPMPDLKSDPLSVKVRAMGPGLSRNTSAEFEAPKPDMPRVDYGLQPSPQPLIPPTPPDKR